MFQLWQQPRTIRIGPKLIEFKDHIIRVPNIASVTIGPDPFRRRISYLLFAASAAALAFFVQGTQLEQLRARDRVRYGSHFVPNDDGTALMLGLLGLALLGLAVYFFTRQALFISKADSRFTLIVDRNPKFMREVMARIREALLAGEAGSVIYQVNVQAGRIERLDASTSAIEVVNSPGAAVVGGDATGSMIEPAVSRNGASKAVATLLAQAQQKAASTARGLAASLEDTLRRSPAEPAEFQSWPQTTATHVDASPGAVVVNGGFANGQLSTSVAINPVADLDQLMHLLQAQNVAHHQQLNSYLAAVRDHLAGGPTPRDQALGYWRWFAEHAIGTLSGVEGVMALVQRIGSWLLRG